MKASPFETLFDSPLLSVSFNVQIVCTTLQIKQTNRLHYVYVHVRRFGFQNPGNICLWNPDSIIQLKESGILLEIGIQNPNPTDKEWNPVPGIQNSRLSWILSHRAKHNLSFNSWCSSLTHIFILTRKRNIDIYPIDTCVNIVHSTYTTILQTVVWWTALNFSTWTNFVSG